MASPRDPSRDLLFGLLALQSGVIDRSRSFVTAFHAWKRDKSRRETRPRDALASRSAHSVRVAAHDLPAGARDE